MKQSGRRGDECHSVIVNEEGKDGKTDADNFLRPWESTERVDAQCLDGWLGRYRKKPSAPSCRALGLRSLVLVGDVGDRDVGATHDPRLRRLPARVVRNPVSC